MSVQVDQLPAPISKLGEGPHWIEKDQALLYIDFFSKQLNRHFVNTGRHQVLTIDDGGLEKYLSFAVPIEGAPDHFIIGLGKTLSIVRWSTNDPDHRIVHPVVMKTATATDHFNDAKCDPRGRLWAGTEVPLSDEGDMIIGDEPSCSLFRFDNDLLFTEEITNVWHSNGLTWSPDGKTFYYIDSPTRKVDAFDYDDDMGTISNRRTVFDYDDADLMDQIPDGMTVDTNGYLWVACFGGGQIICINPNNGELVRRVQMPVKCVTSVCWGGPKYDILYVTSSKFLMVQQEIDDNPSAGGVFAISNTGAKGFPSMNFKPDLKKLRSMLIGYKTRRSSMDLMLSDDNTDNNSTAL